MEFQEHSASRRHTSRGRWILIGFMAIAAYFLWTEHKAHVIEFLPYLLLLVCPLMHLFHHGGHRHEYSRQSFRTNTETGSRESSPNEPQFRGET